MQLSDVELTSLEGQEWLNSQGGKVLPRKILGGDEQDLARLGFSLGPEIDDLFQRGNPPDGWEMRPSDRPPWSFIYDPQGRKRVGVFFKASDSERLAHMMILADDGALA